MIKLDKERQKPQLWLPTMPLSRFFSSDDLGENAANHQSDDENPGMSCFSVHTTLPLTSALDVLQGIEEYPEGDLGFPSSRDPDALPPENIFQLFMN